VFVTLALSDDPFLSLFPYEESVKEFIDYTSGCSSSPEAVAAIGERLDYPLQEFNLGKSKLHK
jgi:hypothetical protein